MVSVSSRTLPACSREATVTIRDTGPGIPAALLPYIFEAFRQGDEQSRNGLGLGLAIARQLVELHGGTIDALNAGPDGGATFVIRVPAPATDLPQLTTAGTSTILSEQDLDGGGTG